MRWTDGIQGANDVRRPIRVLVADDHVVVRRGIRALLKTEADIEVVGEAENGREAVAEAEALRPDMILMDSVMPEMDGIEATRYITARQPEVRRFVDGGPQSDDITLMVVVRDS